MCMFNYLICAVTDTTFIKFGPFYSDEPLDAATITKNIQEQLIIHEMTEYTTDRVMQIKFMAFNGECYYEEDLDIKSIWPKFKNKPFNPLRKEVKKTTNGKEFFCKDCCNNKM